MRIQRELPRYRGLGIISLCILSVMFSGCGRKMFPRPEGAPPPPQVKDLAAQVMPRGVELSWTPLSGDEAKGNIYSIMRSEVKWENRACLECPAPESRQIQKMDPAAVKPDPDGKLRWIDTDVSYRRALRYQISLIGGEKGGPISLSNPAIAKVYPGPAAPVGVVAISQPQGILLQWKPVLKNLEGKDLKVADLSFRVERVVGDKGWEKASPHVKGNSYYDQSVAPEHSYTYRVIPVLFIDEVNIFGEPSATVSVKGPESMPPSPPSKVWIVPAQGGLEVNWTESEGKNSGYHVYRREGKEIIRLTATPLQRPPFLDKGAKKGLTYFYAVSAVSSQPDHKEGLLSKWTEVRNLLPQ
jgi:hypothetical protein